MGQEANPNFRSFWIKNDPSDGGGLCLPGGNPKVTLPFVSLLHSWTRGDFSFELLWGEISALRASPKVNLQSCFLISRQSWVKPISESVCFSVSKVFGPMFILLAKVGEKHFVTQTEHWQELTLGMVTWHNVGWGSPVLLQAGLNVSQISSDKVRLAFNFLEFLKNGLGYFKPTVYLLPVSQMSNLYYLLSTSCMSNILLSKLCCGSFCLVKVPLECKYHVMPLIWRWGQMEGSVGLPPGKNGGLSCFPHLVLRVHSTGSSVIAYQGKNITRLHRALCGQDLCSEITDVWARCWMLMCAALNAGHKPTTHLGYLFYFSEKRKTRCTWMTLRDNCMLWR